MLNHRMLSASLIASDSFNDMSHSAQLLYLNLALTADDDGVTDSARSVMKRIGMSDEHLCELIESGYIIKLDGHVHLIRHWHVHNRISDSWRRASRYSHLLKAFKVDGMGVYERVAAGEDKPSQAEDKPASNGIFTKEFLEEGAFELRVAEYFFKNRYMSSPDSFIAYNKSRGWRGVGGESVKENYERYADEWEKSYRLKHDIDPFERI